jgi:dTDP-4-dehydrorhamnose reductase
MRKRKIYVLGSKGMLGRYVYNYFLSKGWDVVGFTRQDIDASIVDEYTIKNVIFDMEEGDVVINCIGTIKPMVDKLGDMNAIKVNSIFPRLLADACESKGIYLIHITTDCVYSGKDGMYDEESLHDCTDVYGKTKSLGEPENCTVVRTSIIGEEVGEGRSLIEWIKSMKDKEANGFTNHRWNGLTCLQVAKVFENIILYGKFWGGVRHVNSPNIVDKKELLDMVSEIYDLNITVNPVEAGVAIDRTMDSKYLVINGFEIPHLKDQIQDMKDFNIIERSNG